MLISEALAQTAPAAGATPGFDLVSFLPLILIFVVFYFLLIRPQQKRQKQLKDMVSALRRGDRVVTAGGIIGTIAKVPGEAAELEIEIAPNVRVRILRSAISEVMAKPEPADADERGRARKTEDATPPAGGK